MVFVPGCHPSTLLNRLLGTSVRVKSITMLWSGRFVANAVFFSQKTFCMDAIMIWSDNQHVRYTQRQYFPGWVTCALVFVKVSMPDCKRVSSTFFRLMCSEYRLDFIDSEICFVKLYEVLAEEMIPFHKIGKRLNCIHLRSHIAQDEYDMLPSSKVYGLIPENIIRRSVHIVRGERAIPFIGHCTFQKQQLINLHDGELDWNSYTFYVNWFIIAVVRCMIMKNMLTSAWRQLNVVKVGKRNARSWQRRGIWPEREHNGYNWCTAEGFLWLQISSIHKSA